MIEMIGAGSPLAGNSSLEGFEIESEFAFNDNMEMPADAGIEFEVMGRSGMSSTEGSLSGAAVDYMVGSKNSIVQKSIDIHESYLGDKQFTFKDKMQLLEKTYSYQLEMTFYNTFMTQTIQKVDSLIQLK